jgi:D-glycero-D-manno-heptose 1,7-bisphosphate phosphatase
MDTKSYLQGAPGRVQPPAVFLDKDGTLVIDVPYNVDPQLVCLAPGVATGLRRLMDAGFKLIVVSNQSGVAKGFFGEEALRGVMLKLTQLLGEHGVRLDGFYYCPHHPDGEVGQYTRNCECRKPAPGLILKAARELQIDLGRSWMIGDILDDVAAGHRAGCRSVLIDNGNETVWQLTEERRPDYRAADLDAAATWILETHAREGKASSNSTRRQDEEEFESEDARVCKSV